MLISTSALSCWNWTCSQLSQGEAKYVVDHITRYVKRHALPSARDIRAVKSIEPMSRAKYVQSARAHGGT